jgi:hypothetical protein
MSSSRSRHRFRRPRFAVRNFILEDLSNGGENHESLACQIWVLFMRKLFLCSDASILSNIASLIWSSSLRLSEDGGVRASVNADDYDLINSFRCGSVDKDAEWISDFRLHVTVLVLVPLGWPTSKT